MKKKFRWFVHVTLRYFVLGLRIKFLNRFYGMNIHETARISLNAKLDKTNPSGVNIGEGTYLAFGAVILAHDMSRNISKSVHIGKNCFIGANSIIMPGVILGDSVVVGAGSVVTKSFEGNVIVSGNPAKIIRDGISTKSLGIML